jgi:hypothetical protein
VSFDKLKILMDFLQSQAYSPKRDKNSSPGMDYVMSHRNHLVRDERVKSDYDDVQSLLEFVWSKISGKYKTASAAYRFLDYKGKGKLKKKDFAVGLEKLRIFISKSDVDKVFNQLDKHGSGVLTFNNFCTIIDRTSVRSIDTHQLQAIENQMLTNIRQEKENEKLKFEQDQLEKLSHASTAYTGLKGNKQVQKRKISTQRLNGISSLYASYASASGSGHVQDNVYGVPNLASDNMNELMHNQFQNDYVEKKLIRDQLI